MAKPELRDHRKFLKLRRLLGEPTPHVMGYLECLWLRGYQTGNPALGDADDVEAAAEYPGERGRFTAAAAAAGFIDLADGETYLIHDLYEHAPPYVKKRMHRAGHAPAGVEWASAAAGDDRKLRPRGRRDGPCGRETGDSESARTTKTRTKKQEPRTKKPPPQTPPPETGGRPADAGRGEGDPPPTDAPAAEQKPPKKPRERNPLFDAVADVSGLDPKTAGGLIAGVAATLAGADPPYAADDVREFGRRFWELCTWAAKDGRPRPTPKEVERYIGHLRAAPAAIPAAKPRSPPTRGESHDAYFHRLVASLDEPDPHGDSDDALDAPGRRPALPPGPGG